MGKVAFYNDTGRVVTIHPATEIHGTNSDSYEPIQPLEIRCFTTPDGTYPWMKLWDYKDLGLSLFVTWENEIVKK